MPIVADSPQDMRKMSAELTDTLRMLTMLKSPINPRINNNYKY